MPALQRGVQRLARALLPLCLAACAHVPHTSNVKDLKKASHQLLDLVRWNDFVGTSQMLVPPLREPFLDARDKRHDDKDLAISDYDMLDVRLSPDGRHGVLVAKLSWTQLPSVSLQSATVTTEFVYEGDTWLVERMHNGPFKDELDVGETKP